MRKKKSTEAKDSAATSALAALTSAGCKKTLILRLLYLYCGGTPESAKETKRTIRDNREQLSALAMRLSELASDVEDAYAFLRANFGIIDHSRPTPAAIMLSSAVFFERTANALREPASERFTGRDHHLFELVQMVKRETGREHYREIADLAQATRQKYRSELRQEVSAESIRKVVQGYRQRLGRSRLNPSKKPG